MKPETSPTNLPAVHCAEVVQFSPLKKAPKPPTRLDKHALEKALTLQRGKLDARVEHGQMLTEVDSRLLAMLTEATQVEELLKVTDGGALLDRFQRLMEELRLIKGENALQRHYTQHPL